MVPQVLYQYVTREYRRLGDSEVSWHCLHCKSVDVNSFTFHAYNIATSNSISLLQDLGDYSVFEPSFTSVQSLGSVFDPCVVSSPRSGVSSGSFHQRSSKRSSRGSHPPQLSRNSDDKLRFLVVNTNSVRGNAAELKHICDYTRPDILGMSETKLDNSVCSAESLPKCYMAICKDRNLHRGGVMIAVHQGLIMDEIPLKDINKDYELFFTWVTLAGSAPPFFVGAYYSSQIDNPSNDSLDGLESGLHKISTSVRNSKPTFV